jgi:hypothetical protein
MTDSHCVPTMGTPSTKAAESKRILLEPSPPLPSHIKVTCEIKRQTPLLPYPVTINGRPTLAAASEPFLLEISRTSPTIPLLIDLDVMKHFPITLLQLIVQFTGQSAIIIICHSSHKANKFVDE